ncbi:MAG TPA: hypothetical protein VJC04_01060 [Candidatus Paceibacterota bacterium]
MNKIQKFLTKLTHKEQKVADELIGHILSQKLDGFNVKKLKGFENFFRVRKGDLRIIYLFENGVVKILDIGRRNDTTYNF